MADMKDVITKLDIRTNENRIVWKAAVGESSFTARFGDMSVLISAYGSEPYASITISVVNEKGTVLDYAEYDGKVNKEHKCLPALYRSAKRVALGTEEKLQELMALLDDAPAVAEPEAEPAQQRRGLFNLR